MTHFDSATSIFVTTEFIQFHRWAGAPPTRNYLSSLHRHLFGVRLEVSVAHNDREMEYHTVLEQLNAYIRQDLMRNWHVGWSCEDIASKIAHWLLELYPDRLFYACTVSEDNENGSTVELRLCS
jgi:hypothetical protein